MLLLHFDNKTTHHSPSNGTGAAPTVSAAAALAERASTSTPPPFAAMWGVVDVKEGLGRTDHWLCGMHMCVGRLECHTDPVIS